MPSPPPTKLVPPGAMYSRHAGHAEALLRQAEELPTNDPDRWCLINTAQAHGTLAIAAATLLTSLPPTSVAWEPTGLR